MIVVSRNPNRPAHSGCLVQLRWTKKDIVGHVKDQVNERLRERRGAPSWRRPLKKLYMDAYRRIGYYSVGRKVFAPTQGRRQLGSLDLGLDEFGRDITKGIAKYVDILGRKGLRIRTIILLGSRAKGRSRADSDIDITVVGDNLPVPVRPLFGLKTLGLEIFDARWHRLCDRPLFLGIEPTECCSPREFLNWLENFRLVALNAMYYGKVVFDDGFWTVAKTRFEELVRTYDLESLHLKEMLWPI